MVKTVWDSRLPYTQRLPFVTASCINDKQLSKTLFYCFEVFLVVFIRFHWQWLIRQHFIVCSHLVRVVNLFLHVSAIVNDTFRLSDDSTLCSATLPMTAAVVVPSCMARHAAHAICYTACIRFQQQLGQHCIGLLHWTATPYTMWLFTMLLRLQEVSIHRLLCILLGCYDLLRARYCWTECSKAESTNLKLGLPEKSRSLTSTAL